MAPRGSKANESNDVTALVAEFDQRFTAATVVICKVCDNSEIHGLVDILLDRGAGRNQISRFLSEKFGIMISPTTLTRHKLLHVRTTE